MEKPEILARYGALHLEFMVQIEANQQKDKRIAELEKQVEALKSKTSEQVDENAGQSAAA